MNKPPFDKIPMVLAVSIATGVWCGLVVAADPDADAVIINQDMALPTIPDADPADSSSPVCIDDTSGLLVAGCDAAIGTQGPKGDTGAPGPQGPAGGFDTDKLYYARTIAVGLPMTAFAICTPGDIVLSGGVLFERK